MSKTEEQNIPKDYANTMLAPKPDANSASVGNGDAVSKKKYHKHKIKFNKKTVLIIGIIVLIVSLAYGTYAITNRSEIPPEPPRDTSEYTLRSEEANKIAEDTIRQKQAQPITQKATVAEKQQYYTNALWVKFADGDDLAVATYYVNEVKEQNITFSLDIQEALVAALMKTEFKQEAKPVITSIIATYSSGLPPGMPDNEYTKQYVEQKINYYKEIEKTL